MRTLKYSMMKNDPSIGYYGTTDDKYAIVQGADDNTYIAPSSWRLGRPCNKEVSEAISGHIAGDGKEIEKIKSGDQGIISWLFSKFSISKNPDNTFNIKKK